MTRTCSSGYFSLNLHGERGAGCSGWVTCVDRWSTQGVMGWCIATWAAYRQGRESEHMICLRSFVLGNKASCGIAIR